MNLPSRKVLFEHFVFGGCVSLFALSFTGIAYAAFTDKVKVVGSSFSVGSADIKLLKDLSVGVENENLVDEKLGPNFVGLSPTWSDTYNVKLFNNSSDNVSLFSNSYYSTANDPDDLRQYINVEIQDWSDTNNNGTVDDGELGVSIAKKTLIKWKTEGIPLGQVLSGEVKGFVLRFSSETMPESKQGKSGVFDFEFSSTGV